MKKQKGITLIALIITIIVILILAGVSISMVAGENGILQNAQTSVEKNRAGEVKEFLSLALEENEIAKHQDGNQKTKEEIVAELLEKNLLTSEEASTLEESDIITIGGTEIDFSQFEVEGFKYFGRKYLIGLDQYLVADRDASVTLYDSDNNQIGQIPALCVTYEERNFIIRGTGTYDGNYIISRNGHNVYLKDENNEEILIAVEEGFCKHYYENSSNWVDYDFSDMNDPILSCQVCGERYDSVVIDGVLYAYNISLDLVADCVDVCYDKNLNGYCALVIDKTKEEVNFENQINGIDVVRVAGFMDRYDKSAPVVKKSTLPERVKYIYHAFSNCQNLIEIPKIPNTVTDMSYAFDGCNSITNLDEVKIPKSVINVNHAFSQCESLTNINGLILPNSLKNIDCLFWGCTSLKNISEFEIPTGVESMQYAFAKCTQLTEFPDLSKNTTLKNMNYAFEDCDSLIDARSLIIPDSVKNIKEMFRYCSSLVYGPKISVGVENMDMTFYQCVSLKYAPDMSEALNVTNMSATFWGNSSLIEIPNIPNSVTVFNNAFSNCPSLTGTIYYPCVASTNHWGTPASIIANHDIPNCTHK